jgi:hypothetical protein
MDRLKEKPGDAAPRADLVKDAAAPLPALTAGDPELRASAIAGRRARLTALGDRDDGVTPGERATIKASLDRELAAKELSPEEHAALAAELEAGHGRERAVRQGEAAAPYLEAASPRVGQRR